MKSSKAPLNKCQTVFFDFDKAYDTTWRYDIIRQLRKKSVQGNIVKFIDSLLLDHYINSFSSTRRYKRHQNKVRVKGLCSSSHLAGFSNVFCGSIKNFNPFAKDKTT